MRAARCSAVIGLAEGLLLALDLLLAKPELGGRVRREVRRFASVVVEQACVDRRFEARLVQLNGEVIDSRGRVFLPCDADFGVPDHDAVAWGGGGPAFGGGDDTDILGLQTEGRDFALISLFGFREGSNVSHNRGSF